jgi:hypothetical protein
MPFSPGTSASGQSIILEAGKHFRHHHQLHSCNSNSSLVRNDIHESAFVMSKDLTQTLLHALAGANTDLQPMQDKAEQTLGSEA